MSDTEKLARALTTDVYVAVAGAAFLQLPPVVTIRQADWTDPAPMPGFKFQVTIQEATEQMPD